MPRHDRCEEKLCAICGSTHFPKSKYVKIGLGLYCSRVCQAKAREIPVELRFWAKVKKSDSCWLWMGAKIGNYGIIWASKATPKVPLYAHRVSWEMHNGPILAGLHVLHRCDTPLCVNPTHLFLGTQADNSNDMWYKGRGVKPPNRWSLRR